MKTIFLVLALALTVSLSGNAATIKSAAKNQTEKVMGSKTNSSSTLKSGKTKKAHAKNHKMASGTKKPK